MNSTEKASAEFSDPIAGHWSTDEGTEMANRYLGMTRDELGHGTKTDLELANAIFMVGRDSLSLMGLQTAAKERIRWLSAQLAKANIELAGLGAPKPASVTDEMVHRAMERAGWVTKPSPPEYESGSLIDNGISDEEADDINAQLTAEMRAILSAVLQVQP